MVSGFRLKVSCSLSEFQFSSRRISLYLLELIFLGLLIIFFISQPLYAKGFVKSKFPHYKFDISYDHDKTLLTGKMQVSFSEEKFPSHELLFSLPGNRFLFPDDRGIRKHKIVPVFSKRRFINNLEDPKSPKGFSFGELKIHSVSTFTKNYPSKKIMLDFLLEQNPNVEVGYSIEKGLLRVNLPKKYFDYGIRSEKSLVEIEFSIKLPRNFNEGSVNGTLLIKNWHPKLLNWQYHQVFNEFKWDTVMDKPSPATFEVKFKVSQPGTLITTAGFYEIFSDQVINIPTINKPLKSFPLIFSKKFKKLIKKNKLQIFENSSSVHLITDPELNSFYFEGQKRRAELFQSWCKSFLKYLDNKYGLVSPWAKITIVPVEAEYEQVEVINNLVLVPLPNYKKSRIMDRQALGFLTRSLAQLWFGESVWNDEDKELWLNLGIPAFLGLRYFQYKFGSDAGIFDAVDWLNPRYRDHYFENMVSSIPPKMTYPILSSFKRNPDSQSFLRILTYKTAMVISMLEFILGEDVFKKGLQYFSKEFNQKIVGKKEFQLAFEKFKTQSLFNTKGEFSHYKAIGQGSLQWFFSQWFETVKTLDYSFEESTTRKLGGGIYETEVKVKNNGTASMPIVVALILEDGNEIRNVLPGIDFQETITFRTKSFPEKVSIDPDEKLMETSRINNHSFNFYRFRFGFDWKKKRDYLVLLVPGLNNNSIDGNSFGLGMSYKFGNYRIHTIPGYGTKNKRFLYIINLDRKNLGFYGLEGGISLYEYGGIQSQGFRMTFEPSSNPGELGYKLQSRFSREKLFSSGIFPGNSEVSEKGETNTIYFEYSGDFSPKNFYEIWWEIWNEQPVLSLPSDFSYVRGKVIFSQVFRVGYRKLFKLDLIRASTSGESPLQKKFQLGGPKVLRGYPQQRGLSDDKLFASRLDFKFPLIDSPFWGLVSTFQIQGNLFYDQGRIWSDDISIEDSKFRKNFGVGIEWIVDTASLFQIPLKFEVAFPLDDQVYKKPQFIFLGVLTGS